MTMIKSKTRKHSTCIAVFGNIFDGLYLYGPFDTAQNAKDWIEKDADHEPYVIVTLKPPVEPKPKKSNIL